MQNHRAEYANRINRVLDHVQSHLGEPMDLDSLARIACFSPFHFHRLFRSWMGETLQQCIQRLRLEKAAHQLWYSHKRITEIALDCGFSGSSAFARAFREHHGCSASHFRLERKFRKALRNPGKALREGHQASWREGSLPPDSKEKTMFPLDVKIQNLPAISVAYLRHIGPYKGNSALFENLFGRLCGWAGPRNFITDETLFMSLYHDDPELTPQDKQRIDVAITVPQPTQPEGEIGRMDLPGGTFAMARVSIHPEDYETAWDALMNGWLPDSGYQPADQPCMEIYRNDPKNDPNGLHILDICLPVKPL